MAASFNVESPRLRYQRLGSADVASFARLVRDEHVLRYLFDGETMSDAWCQEAAATSQRAHDSDGLGLWLVFAEDEREPIGFAGFWTFQELGPEAQLLYALVAQHTGKGYATEIARALVGRARATGIHGELSSAVDAPNTGSIRVLEKVGFVRVGEAPGAFGTTLLYRLPRA